MAQLVLGQTTGAKGASNSKTYDPRSTYGINATNQSRSSMAKQTVVQNNSTKAALRNNTQPTGGGSSGGGGGTTAQAVATSSGGGGSYNSEINYENELLEKIKSLLSSERQSMYDAAKAAYEQSLLKNSTDSESLSNDANVKRERNDRFIRSLYGPGMGQGISNRIANHNRWADTLASIKSNRANNDLIALNTYNQNKANADNMYTQGLYSYVMPVYTNRQNYSDSLQNQLRLYQMQLENSKL